MRGRTRRTSRDRGRQAKRRSSRRRISDKRRTDIGGPAGRAEAARRGQGRSCGDGARGHAEAPTQADEVGRPRGAPDRFSSNQSSSPKTPALQVDSAVSSDEKMRPAAWWRRTVARCSTWMASRRRARSRRPCGLAQRKAPRPRRPPRTVAPTRRRADAAEIRRHGGDEMFNKTCGSARSRRSRDAVAARAEESILYVSAGMDTQRRDNQVELRGRSTPPSARTSRSSHRHARLQAVVPGGSASRRRRGSALFSGRGVAQQFAADARRTRSSRWPPTPAARRSWTRTTSARRSRASSATCPRITCSATTARTSRRTAASAASACGSKNRCRAPASRHAPATTPIAISRTPRAATARRSSRRCSSPPSRRPISRSS